MGDVGIADLAVEELEVHIHFGLELLEPLAKCQFQRVVTAGWFVMGAKQHFGIGRAGDVRGST